MDVLGVPMTNALRYAIQAQAELAATRRMQLLGNQIIQHVVS